jgi:spore coat protein H
MKKNLKHFSLAFIFMIFISSNIASQNVQKDSCTLNLADSDRKIENKISIDLPTTEYESLQAVSGEKINLKPIRLVINGENIEQEEIHTRGQTSLYFKRKSLNFKLKSVASFQRGEKHEKLRKFDLISLSMDKYYTRNRLAFEMMEKIGIFDLYYTFCELRVNGKSEGIFMVVERPEDWAFEQKKSPLMIRRGYDHKIDKVETEKKAEKGEIKKYEGYYRNIYKSLNKYEGEELYNTLSQWMDVDNYMKWLAFNYFVRNGDYSDEVFFYIDPEIGKYRIIPWDYDDIFAIAPHEGKDKAFKNLGEKPIFSTEDVLDVKIVTDPFLYKKYLVVLKEVLEELSPCDLKDVFDQTYAELFPYFSDQEIISQSQYDAHKDANLENLKTEIVSLYLGINGSREIILKKIENQH